MSRLANRFPPPAAWKIVLAMAIIYFVWGATYLAIRVAVETIPPAFLAGSRFLVAGASLLLVARLCGEPFPDHVLQWRDTALAGVLFFLFGNGLVCWAEQTIPSGLAALIITTTPLWLLSMEASMPGGDRLTRRDLAAFAVGLAGVALLVSPQLGDGRTATTWGVLALLGAAAAWSAGSTVARHGRMPASVWVASGLEMLAGGVALIAFSVAAGEPARFDAVAVPASAWVAWLFLTVFGSLVAFSAYVWLLGHVRVSVISTCTYVNPVVAIYLGVVCLDEPVSASMLSGAAVTLVAVAMATMPRRSRGDRTGPQVEEHPSLPLPPTVAAPAVPPLGEADGSAAFD